MQGRDALDQVLGEVRRAGRAVGRPGIPDGDLVDLEVLDGFDLARHDVLDLFDHEEGRRGLGVAAAAFHELGIAGGLAFEQLPHAFGLGLVLEQYAVGFALGDAPDALGLGFRGDLHLALLDFLLGHFGGVQALGLGFVLGFLDFHFGHALGHFAALLGLGLLDDQGGVVVGDFRLGLVFAADGLGFLLLHVDAPVGFGMLHAFLAFRLVFRHADVPLLLGLGFADRAQLVLLGHVDHGLVHGFGRGLLAQRVDVAGHVGDVRDVDVDEVEADLVELRLHVAPDRRQEALAVLIDLLDGQGGHGQAQLAEDDFAGHLLDFGRIEPQQAFGGVGHDRRIGADADGERAGHVHADVLQRQGALQRDVDGHRCQAQERAVLDQRPDEGAAAVDALGRHVADLAVDDEDGVGRAALVARGEENERRQEQGDERDDEQDPAGGHGELSFCYADSTSRTLPLAIRTTLTRAPVGRVWPPVARASSTFSRPLTAICTLPTSFAGMVR